jgi:hypothetical protein
MEFDIGSLNNGRMRLQGLVMARGEYCLETLEAGEVLAFVLAYGCLQITRQRGGQPASYSLHATPRAPLMIINPGTYCVVAERSALGCGGAGERRTGNDAKPMDRGPGHRRRSRVRGPARAASGRPREPSRREARRRRRLTYPRPGVSHEMTAESRPRSAHPQPPKR